MSTCKPVGLVNTRISTAYVAQKPPQSMLGINNLQEMNGNCGQISSEDETLGVLSVSTFTLSNMFLEHVMLWGRRKMRGWSTRTTQWWTWGRQVDEPFWDPRIYGVIGFTDHIHQSVLSLRWATLIPCSSWQMGVIQRYVLCNSLNVDQPTWRWHFMSSWASIRWTGLIELLVLIGCMCIRVVCGSVGDQSSTFSFEFVPIPRP